MKEQNWSYKPSRFMLPTSHYDKQKADMAVLFVEQLKHTKGIWAGKPFLLLPWEEQIIRDLFGIVKQDGTRQFHEAYIECGKKSGKSELAAAIALLLLYLDNEPSAEIYGAAGDRNQASLVFDVALQFVVNCPALMKRSKVSKASKQIFNKTNNGVYRVVSAEVGTKAGVNASGVIFDEVFNQPDERLYQILTRGSGDARQNSLILSITTAGFDLNSFCYTTLHTKALNILKGKAVNPTFYPVIYTLEEGDDWQKEESWYKANPSLGITVPIERFREAYQIALENPAEENYFKTYRLNTWGSNETSWLPFVAEAAMPDWICPVPQIFPHWFCFFRRKAKTIATMSCHIFGFRKIRFKLDFVMPVCNILHGKSKATYMPRREMWWITHISVRKSIGLVRFTTFWKSELTHGMQHSF